ncbi:hypothetical protein BX666DRAFT_775524 [Dichotomocladium elegans]|nr:hypothetical protein BX666DRAFT_775524 [Dichotomocladium elegans]
MGLLILYYVYKWMTVPWSYYEEARTRRTVHQNTVRRQHHHHQQQQQQERYRELTKELQHHERVGLMWVLLSPCIVAYSLRFSSYLLTNHDRYMGYFNVTIFLLAALIRPCGRLLSLFQDRMQELQSALKDNEREIDVLQKRVDHMDRQMDELHDALVAKTEVIKITTDIRPLLKRTQKVARRVDREDWFDRPAFEDRYMALSKRVNELNHLILYRIEQDQVHTSQRTIVTLMLLPAKILVWIVQYARSYLPFQPHHSTSSPSVASCSPC